VFNAFVRRSMPLSALWNPSSGPPGCCKEGRVLFHALSPGSGKNSSQAQNAEESAEIVRGYLKDSANKPDCRDEDKT
jgi:hypothetical protein